jgi:molecular chaperone DnaK (HSP70)
VFFLPFVDLGVSFTTAAYTNKDGEFTLVRNDHGNTRTPTTIAFVSNNSSNTSESYKILIGEAAESQRSGNPSNTIHDWQRWTFRPFNSTKGASVVPEIHDLSYKVVESLTFPSSIAEIMSRRTTDSEWARDPVGQAVVQVSFDESRGEQARKDRGEQQAIGGETVLYFRPEDLTVMLVHRVLDLAEAQIRQNGTGTNITHVVLAIPGDLGWDQQAAIRYAIEDAKSEAMEQTGQELRVLRVTTRHHSTAMAYGLESWFVYGDMGAREAGLRTVVVVDMEEEGEFDVRLLEIDSGMYETMGGAVERSRRKGLDCENSVERAVVDAVVEAFLKGERGEILEEGDLRQQKEMILNDQRLMRRLTKELVKVIDLFPSTLQLLASPSNATTTRHSIRLEMESFFQGKDLSIALNLQQYLNIRSSTLQPIIDTMEHLLKKHMQIDNKAHVDHILVTGTSSRIPEAIQLLEQYFENRLAVPQLIDPALASVHGAARVARMYELKG